MLYVDTIQEMLMPDTNVSRNTLNSTNPYFLSTIRSYSFAELFVPNWI